MAAGSGIQAGDQLRCAACGHQRTVTSHWLGEIRKHFPARHPMVLRSSDLKRFRCSGCGEKSLEIVEPAVPVLATPKEEYNAIRKLAVTVVNQASAQERRILLDWAKQLVAIRDGHLSTPDKAKAAIKATIESKAILPFLKVLGTEIKRLGWDERGFAARMGIGAAAVALFLPGKGAAGIAALGGAVGVPLWIVFGAGGAFAGVIIQELQKPPSRPSRSNGEKVVEGTVLDKKITRRQDN